MVNRIPPRANIPSANDYAQAHESQVSPAARGSTLGQPRGRGIEQKRQRVKQLTEAVTEAISRLQLARVHVPSSQNSMLYPGMLSYCSSLIQKIDALDAESSSARQKIVSDRQLVSVLMARIGINRNVLREKFPAMNCAFNSLSACRNSPISFWQQNDNNVLDNNLKQCDEGFKIGSLQVVDLRRVRELDPSDRRLSEMISVAISEAIIFKIVALSFATQRLQYKATDLESLLGEPSAQLLRQSEALGSVICLFHPHRNVFLSDHLVDETRLVAKDLSTVCLDLAACAMDLALPEPSSNHTMEQISQAKCLLDDAVGHCLDMSDLISQWDAHHPRSGSDGVARELSTRTDSEPSGFVSVRAANGMHVPAQLQSNGKLSTVGLELELIAPSPSSDVNVSEADEAQTGSEEDSVSDSGSVRASSRAAKILQKGLALVASDFQKEFHNVTDRKGYTDPDILTASYKYHAEKWLAQAANMRSIADKLVSKFSDQTYDTEEQTQEARELPGRLQERATALESKAQELLSPETRWSLIKSYARPQAQQWSELFDAQQIEIVGRVTELAGTTLNTNPVFEVRIQALPGADGTRYPPVWLHLHPTQRMTVQQVSKAKFDRFDAVHLKSDADKNRGQKWVQAQRAGGNFDADVHRSKVDADLHKKIMSFDKPVIPKRSRAAKK